MRRYRVASMILAAVLVPTALAVAQTGTGSDSPPPARDGGTRDGGPAGRDGLGGPRVPGDARDGNRDFRGGDRRGGAQRGGADGARGGPVADERAWMQALEKVEPALTEEQKSKIHQFREEYREQVRAWQQKNEAELRELNRQLQEARRAGQVPDPALSDKMKKIQDSRPKFQVLQRRIAGMLNPEQQASHKKLMEEAAQGAGPRGDRARGRGDGAGGPPSGAPGGSPRGERPERPARGQRPPPPPEKDPME